MADARDNKEAARPDTQYVSSLIPTMRPVAALGTKDGHAKRTTARTVFTKVLNACMILLLG